MRNQRFEADPAQYFNMKTHLLIIFILYSLGAVSQAHAIKFGDISREELLMTRYDKDTLAAAVILYDHGETGISYGGTVQKRHLRIKVFNKDAFNEWATVTLYSDRSRTPQIQGATYNYDHATGKTVVTDLKEDDIYKTRFNKYLYKITFALPNLSENAILEYTYTMKSTALYIPSWTFQYSIPVKYSEYLLSSDLPVRSDIRGLLPAKKQNNYKNKYQRWVMENIPAFKKEPYMPHEDTYRSAINFLGAMKSWWSIAEMLNESEDFGKDPLHE